MMLDTHLHLMLNSFYGRPPTDIACLLANLDTCGIDGGWVSAIDGMITRDLDQQRQIHDRLAANTASYANRLCCFCTVDPSGLHTATREIERCVRELGFIGVKIHSWLQGFSLTHPGMELIMEVAGALGVPVLFHDGTPPYSSTRQVARLAERYPQTTVILGHSGLADSWQDAIDAARQCPNIWVQPAASPVITIRKLVNVLGINRMLFGSDSGFGSVHVTQYVVAKYRTVLDEASFSQIGRQNPLALLQAAREAHRPPTS